MKRLMVCAAMVLVTSSVTGTQGPQSSADTALRSAIETETVKGDLKTAIAQYKRIIELHRDNRPIRAQALLRLAQAYQRLGDAQARLLYEQVIREYADQSDAVAAARRFLITGAAPRADHVVKSGESVTWGDGRVSSDGRFVCYTDWQHTGNLMLHDLVAGTDRALTGNKDWSVGNAYTSTFSPDGKQVAYGWRTYSQPAINELRVLHLDPGSGVRPRRVHGLEDIDFYKPLDWSPDGKWLAVHVTRKDRTGQIALVAVQDGSFRALKSVGWRGPNKIFFSPDGKYLAYDLPATATAAQRDVFIIATDASREIKATEHAAHDVVMGWTPDGRLLFASDRTGSVGLWAQTVADGKPLHAPVLLKPDIGTTLSQGLTAVGSLYTVKDATTLSMQIAPIDLRAGRLTGPPVLENFRSGRPDWTADGKQLAYEATGASGIPAIAVRSVDSGTVRELRPAMLYINEPRWLAGGRALVVMGRDFNGRGVIIQVDAQTGGETFIDEAAAVGRVQVSPDGKTIYYDGRPSAPNRFVARNLETGEIKDLEGPVGTGPAGVRYGNPELSPDGSLFAVVRTDVPAKATTLVVYPVSGGQPRTLFKADSPDALRAFGGLTWTADSEALLVVNTFGETLGAKDLWLVPITGGNPRKLDVDVRAWKLGGGIRLHPNGRQIAFFSGDDAREVWALDSIAPGPSATAPARKTTR